MTGAAEPARPGLDLGALLDRAAARLRAAGIEGARRDARLLLAAASGLTPGQVMAYPERQVSDARAAEAERMIARRARREPVSRILGRREFWGLEFRITPDTLDPRPDSETLVAAVLQRTGPRDGRYRILDLGTGSGCLLLALLAELPEAEGVGIDLAPGALSVARENAARLGLAPRARFARGDWAEALDGPWQVIVSNPPYIIGPQIDDLSPEVADFDPRLALDAGTDGLNSYRKISPRAADILAPDGLLVLEIGAGQGEGISRLLLRSGLAAIERLADLSGTERCLVARRPGRGAGSQTGDDAKKQLE